MNIKPVGMTASLLVQSLASANRTPHVLRMGLARSLLAERLRRWSYGSGGFFVGHSPPARPRACTHPIVPEFPPSGLIKPIDRHWPSDAPLKTEATAHSTHTRPSPHIGLLIDIWA